MNKNNLLVRYDKDLRLRIMYPEARREITDNVVRFVRKAPGMNFVSFTFANETKLHQVMRGPISTFFIEIRATNQHLIGAQAVCF